MPLIRIDNLGLSFGPHVILEDANLQLYKGDRVCLIGRNGAGKSTLMKLVAQQIQPDAGSIWFRPGIKIARLEQELPPADHRTVLEFVSEGLAETAALLEQYDTLASQAMDEKSLERLARLQHQLEAVDGWSLQQKVDEVITRLGLPSEQRMDALSGGWRRRVALGQALVTNPDILLLDEPTNHLDIETIEWLEKHLLEFNGAILFITHDRSLVRRLATKVVELDRGNLQLFPSDYDNYLTEKEHQLEVEEQQNALFDKRLAQEEVWIRQGIKARRTRNEGRVRALKRLREERSQRRERVGSANIQVEQSSLSGKIVAELTDVSFGYGDKKLFEHVSTRVMRGDKIGLIGPNGVGKTTLLKIILGELEATSGKVQLGTKQDVVYFDQMRDHLEDDKTIVDTVGQGRDSITINGKDRHIMSYLSDFLFSPERARTPLKALSGGERNRVQLACLFSQPANILVLDEPTNDLDVETLELLESIFIDFGGTILLVSHDREFMDNVVSSTLVFEGDGVVNDYIGGYEDWIRQTGGFAAIREKRAQQQKRLQEKQAAEQKAAAVSESKPKKLSYKLQRELDELPELIEGLETQQQELQAITGSADFYQQDKTEVAAKLQQLADLDQRLQQAYQRWEELAD
ncbi:ATP-binding cassette domain-containing protein [Dasania sp. GY-MA-18]|uniref:ATP-binding protein Uup n=1 Tax=Dasania phycosphaerae TaxID=2950436 RepID=A0A9J6RHN4_9GAMM|nr:MULTISPECIES: ATP-binding cassette domain-containing protein [Dasania]MCR8921754.1 ATP-binding cassette domain-containing protein [Dasania sp. GY-MA-18]MCZ0864182.1 ATP-binding cassette domain-containing protein [Dasania phycosphaerae]MCZ0867910.1 ATP-binding cassette domain-containing protein [Dasania phycosphaerae]